MSSHRSTTRHPSREDRAFFEALVALRDRYPALAAADSVELVSVRHAIAQANADMRRSPEPRQARAGVIRLGNEAN